MTNSAKPQDDYLTDPPGWSLNRSVPEWRRFGKFLGLRHISYAEFYVTNHCNITCDNCNRFNNHKISGSADWETHKDTYRKWSHEVTIDRIALLGGEPLLHPNLHKIISNVAQWWYESEVEITTNGLLIEKIKPHLQQAIIDHSVTVYVSIHNKAWLEKIKASVVEKFGKLKLLESHSEEPYGGHDVFMSESGNKVILEYTYYFRTSALYYDSDQDKYKLHNSDPQQAHSVCDMKHSFHFWKGCLYKCGVMVTLPYMIEQKSNRLSITDQQKELLNQYQPITVEDVEKDCSVVDQLFDYIPQCEFCPSKYNRERKKIFVE